MPSSFCTPPELARSPSCESSFGAMECTSRLDDRIARTAGRAAPMLSNVPLNFTLKAATAPPAALVPPSSALARAPLFARASNAAASPRNAFCASNGMRCRTNESSSADAACALGGRVSSTSQAATAMHATDNAASAGNMRDHRFVSSDLVIARSRPLARRLQETLALHEALQTQHRPHFAAAAKCTGEVTVAANHGRRRIRAELPLREAAKAEHLVDHQSSRDIA